MGKELVYLLILIVLLLTGCSGNIKHLFMQDRSGQMKTVVFPNGTVFGGASKDQATTLAQIFVDSHNILQQQLTEMNSANQRALQNQEVMQSSMQGIEQAIQQNQATANRALEFILELSRQQGTGEITLFYPVAVSTLKKGTLEYERLVRFLDYLARESQGRQILFISIGSASAFGNPQNNVRLARERAESPLDMIRHYLVNIPYHFFNVYGVGDRYSLRNVTMQEHQRYQNTRLIAFYQTDQIPSLPEKISYSGKVGTR